MEISIGMKGTATTVVEREDTAYEVGSGSLLVYATPILTNSIKDLKGFFEEAMKKGVRVFARSSLLQGLAVMDPQDLPSRVSFAKDYLLKYHNICTKYQMSKLDVAILIFRIP